MTVSLPYLDFTLVFLFQHKSLVFIVFLRKYSLMRIGVCLATDIFVGGTVIVQNLLFLLFIHGLCPPVIWIDMIDWFWC